MRITFLECGASPRPTGGARVLYEHANRLVARGHAVSVVHPVYPESRPGFLAGLKQGGRHKRWARTGEWSPRAWMDVDPRVDSLWTPDLSSAHVPEGDVVIAAHWRAVAPMNALSPAHGARVFFSRQWDFAEFAELEPGVRKAWAAPCFKMVVNRRAAELARVFGPRPWLAPHGLDSRAWDIDVPLADRDPDLLITPWRAARTKGFHDVLEACELARRERPTLRLLTFGTEPMSIRLPHWVTHVPAPDRPALRALYNRASVFVGAGHNEGWGLAASEAGLCGAALALTDNPGHAEYADHERTALVSPIREPAGLAVNILALAERLSLRQRLALAARAKLSTFTWERASRTFEAGLMACIEAETPRAVAS